LDFLQNGLRSVWRKRLRSGLTVMGIGIGVLSVVLISIIGEVGKAAVNDELNSMGISGLCVSAGTGTGKSLSPKGLSLVQENSWVSAATPLVTDYTTIVSRGLQVNAVVWGVDKNAAEIVSMKLLYGRLIGRADVGKRAKVCVVDESFAQLLYKRDNIVGKSVRLLTGGRYEDFTVVGVVASGGNLLQSLMGDVVPTFLYAPYTTLSALSHEENFSQIVAKLAPEADEAQAAESIAAVLRAETGESIKVENLNRQKERLNGILDKVTLVLALIGGISLVVAGLSIMTVMLVTVRERTREIGVKKAIGASQPVILWEFLTEALLLSLIGSILGCAAGILLGAAGCAAVGLPLSLRVGNIVLAAALAVGIGTLFGVYPAVQASRLPPAQALRSE